ncbi:rhamnulokinase [Enterococcus sp. LJL51]|uniref:rhamnulokinase n=1 Tax=Enterococcus sp. LJL51 TaxID=3416656 RepID=UPI003CF949C6
MKEAYIAVDIGASSGRLMKSNYELDDRITLEEVHRFKNGFSQKDGHDRWEINRLIEEIINGLEKVKQSGIEKCYVGIDTWAVDYCLIDKHGCLKEAPISYRDDRTKGAVQEFTRHYSLEKLYEKTGIQIQPFNTIFQLLAEDQQKLREAHQLLLIPDYIGYVFTGKAVTEKTNASTMQLLNPESKNWDGELLKLVGLREEQLPPLVEAGTVLGTLLQEKFPTRDLPEATFITVATHDTASAVIGTPGCGENWAYISSGTWSLLGIETTLFNVSRQAFFENYTNEWGAHNTIRFLKNIMGMWLIQEVARMQKYQYSYAELAEQAAAAPGFQQFIDVNDPVFLNPDNMIEALQSYCRNTNQKVPETAGELARCIYDNLALCYAVELEKMEGLTGTGEKINKLHIVGGGANNLFLNQLTANAAGIPVEAGPGEATAIGNILMQMIATGIFNNLEEARKVIQKSFDFSIHQPEPFDNQIIEAYKSMIEGAKK